MAAQLLNPPCMKYTLSSRFGYQIPFNDWKTYSERDCAKLYAYAYLKLSLAATSILGKKGERIRFYMDGFDPDIDANKVRAIESSYHVEIKPCMRGVTVFLVAIVLTNEKMKGLALNEQRLLARFGDITDIRVVKLDSV